MFMSLLQPYTHYGDQRLRQDAEEEHYGLSPTGHIDGRVSPALLPDHRFFSGDRWLAHEKNWGYKA